MIGARVLVVDDETAGVEILVRALANAGHLASGAGSAEEAASALAASSYDLVLLDQVLPGATGMQALGRLRALTRAPIHLMSGYSDEGTRRDAQLLGATGFLEKPFALETLLALVAALPEKP